MLVLLVGPTAGCSSGPSIDPETLVVDSGDSGTMAADSGQTHDAGDAGTPDSGSSDAGSLPALTPGEYERHITTTDGRDRRYLVYVPAGAGSDAPVLLNLHGGGGSAEFTRDGTNFGVLADRERFILVHPEGIQSGNTSSPLGPTSTWNAGACCSPATTENVDDVAYLNQVLDDILSVQNFDQARVYATGFSNGSMMTQRFACESADRIAAIAPVSGGLSGISCNPQRPIPVMYIHGRDDVCANFDGGAMCGGCFQRFVNAAFNSMLPVPTNACSSAEDNVLQWRLRNTCEQTSTQTYSVGNAQCETWACAERTEVTFCPVTGMGHTWPGGAPPSFCDRPNSAVCQAWLNEVGGSTEDIGDEQIWAFLSRHRRP